MSNAEIGVVIHTSLCNRLFSPEDRCRLEQLSKTVWTDSAEPIDFDTAINMLENCRIGIGSWGTPWPNEQLLSACPHLELWIHVAGSVKFMFGPHLEGRNLTIASCAPSNGENVAEMVLGELIIGLKRVLENAWENRIQKADCPKNSFPLASSTVGVIGASNVGRHIIRMLKFFGAKILVYDPYVNQKTLAEMGAIKVDSLLEICKQANAITMHTPRTEETNKMIGEQEFKAMRDDAVFINSARPSCIDEDALVEELKKGRFFAFIDVASRKYSELDSPLRTLPNVVLTSHIAGQPDFKMGRQAVDDVEAFLKGEKPAFVITKEMLAFTA